MAPSEQEGMIIEEQLERNIQASVALRNLIGHVLLSADKDVKQEYGLVHRRLIHHILEIAHGNPNLEEERRLIDRIHRMADTNYTREEEIAEV